MMDSHKPIETRLTGGHPNSLGNTVEVVDDVLANPEMLEELFNCYFSDDEVVRLRTSNGLKRICKVKPSWLIPYVDRLLEEISEIDQASTQWTLADLFGMLTNDMTDAQMAKAMTILKRNLTSHDDWIVLNQTMATLGKWAVGNDSLKRWMIPHLRSHALDKRKSVSKRAQKLLVTLDN